MVYVSGNTPSAKVDQDSCSSDILLLQQSTPLPIPTEKANTNSFGRDFSYE
jgi:hypothetical protein